MDNMVWVVTYQEIRSSLIRSKLVAMILLIIIVFGLITNN